MYLDKHLNNYQKETAFRTLRNSSMYYYQLFFENLKKIANSSSQNNKNVNIKTDDFLAKDYNRFSYKINKMFLNPHLAAKLDDGTIDYDIMDALNQWYKFSLKYDDACLFLRKKPIYFEYFRQPITLAMLDENIVLFNKYTNKVSLEQNIYRTYLYPKMASMKHKKNQWQRLYYMYYRYCIAFKFAIDFWQIGFRKALTTYFVEGQDKDSSKFVHGYNLKWDIPMELYKGNFQRNYYLDNFIMVKNIY